jgi:predicted ATPase/DNA-binding CsgD family transcriptional regulator/DNA-binding XRE family transcriptional regulator
MPQQAIASFGEQLRQYRRAAGLTQEALAERAGLSVHRIQKLERGVTNPYRDTAQRLAAALQLGPYDEDQFRAAVQPVRRRETLRSHTPWVAARRNLPIPLSSFIGRDKEQAEVLRLMHQEAIRLVTLTGPGGVGKTRLALKVASQLINQFDDGVVFISLAPVADPVLVISAIAHALDVREVNNVSLLRTLQTHLSNRALLLLFDNFEHVVTAAPLVADLLTACPRLQILATSRAPLHVRGEYEVAVLPLRLPEPSTAQELEAFLGADAVRLFQQRAQAVKAEFVITRDNAESVADICRRLDGLPLAIELAAARIKVMPPTALLAHLQRRLPILTGGARDLPTRQHTLREAIAWSYRLLGPSHQQLFRRLTVFFGGCTSPAVAAVCADDGDAPHQVLDGLAALVDQSLLRQDDSVTREPRYQLLETIREYGLDQLAASGEAEIIGRRHAEYFLALAEDAEAGLAGTDWRIWRWQLQAEHENLRAALDWAVAWGETDLALRLVGSLWRWFRPDAIAEGRRWIQQALALPGAGPQSRAKALFALGVLAMQQGDYRVAADAWKESISIWRVVGAVPRLADALMYLASIYRPDARAVPALLGESIVLARQAGDPRRLALALGFLAWQVLQSAGPDAARPLLAEALPLARTPGDPWELIWVLYVSGLLAVRDGDTATARGRFAEALELAREARDNMMASLALAANGRAALQECDTAEAALQFRDGLRLGVDAGFAIELAYNLEGIALVCRERSQFERAARLLGAAEAAYALVDVPGLVPYGSLVQREVNALRESLGQDAFAAGHSAGRGLRTEVAIADALAMEVEADGSGRVGQGATNRSVTALEMDPPDGLTPREVEVLRLLVAGHTNPEIAAALVISVKTVERHLANVYAKIGARSRVDAATYMLKRGLR